MAKYSYAVIRRAIACKIMECEKIENKEFIDDVSDWTIYKEINEKEIYHLIKITSNTNDGYKFPFDESKIAEHYDDNIINIFKFLHFNNSENKEEKCENIKSYIDFRFYLVLNNEENVTEFLTDNQSKGFKYLVLDKELFNCCENETIKISKISKCFNSLLNTGIKVKGNPKNNCYDINLYPYPCNYNSYNINNNLISITINNNNCDNVQKNSNRQNLPNTDYNRILERSFIYQIEYGTEVEFNEILTFCYERNNNNNECCKKSKEANKCKFDNLKKFIQENQEKIKDNDLITRFNKLAENKKNEYHIYDFKEIFKCYFGTKIKIDEFKERFFSKNKKRKCAYCGVPEDRLDLLYTVRNGRGNRLEYDRIISRDGNKKVEYTLSNIVLACYWCNNAKTDTFSPKEFKPIAKGINQVWNEKLKEKYLIDESIYFEENAEIWNKES